MLFFFSSNGQHRTRPVSAARPWLWLLNMWEMLQGSSLSPDSLVTWSVRRWRWRRRRPPRQIHHLLDLSLPPSPPSSRLRSLALVCLIFFHIITNADQKKKGERRNNNAHTQTHRPWVYTTRASCWFEHRAPLRTARHSFLFFFLTPVCFLFSFLFFSRAFVTRHLWGCGSL